MREYGLDLKECLWGQNAIGVRKLVSLVEQLPLGCSLHRSLDPKGFGSGWHTNEELLATAVELLDVIARANFPDKSGKLPKPFVEVPRPGVKQKASPDQLKEFLQNAGIPVRYDTK